MSSGPLETGMPPPICLGSRFKFALYLTMHSFDRWIFEEYYLPADLSCDCRHYYVELVELIAEIRSAADDMSVIPDDDTYDILWIYFVGAYPRR